MRRNGALLSGKPNSMTSANRMPNVPRRGPPSNAKLRSLRETPMITKPSAWRRRPEAALRLGTAAALATVFLFPTDLASQRREPIPSPFAPLGIQADVRTGHPSRRRHHRKDGVNLEPRPFADLHPGNDAGRAGAVRSGREPDRLPHPGRNRRGNHGDGFGDAALPGRARRRSSSCAAPGGACRRSSAGWKARCRFPARTMGASACCFRSRPTQETKRAARLTHELDDLESLVRGHALRR